MDVLPTVLVGLFILGTYLIGMWVGHCTGYNAGMKEAYRRFISE